MAKLQDALAILVGCWEEHAANADTLASTDGRVDQGLLERRVGAKLAAIAQETENELALGVDAVLPLPRLLLALP